MAQPCSKTAAMLCTASVEEVIDQHYQNQIDQLGDDEIKLKKKITKFRQDELHQKILLWKKEPQKKAFTKCLME